MCGIAAGVDFLDAPVSGGESGAISATLSIMVGGRREAHDRCLPILQVVGNSITYMGASGTGQTTKLCNQTIASLNLLAMCEGLALGAKAGLDMEKLLSVVSAGAAGSWMLSNLGPQILARDLEPGFKVCLMQKDLRLALASAEELELPLPGLSLVHQLCRSVEAAGDGGEGYAGACRGGREALRKPRELIIRIQEMPVASVACCRSPANRRLDNARCFRGLLPKSGEQEIRQCLRDF